MGDIGSLTLGGILGVSAVLLRREFLLGIVGGIFVAESPLCDPASGQLPAPSKETDFFVRPSPPSF